MTLLTSGASGASGGEASSGSAATTFPVVIGGTTQAVIGSTYLSIGTSANAATTPATTGNIRGHSTFSIVARNSTNVSNFALAALVGDQVVIGDAGTQTILQSTSYIAHRTATHYFQTAGGSVDVFKVERAKLTLYNSNAVPSGAADAGTCFIFAQSGDFSWSSSGGYKVRWTGAPATAATGGARTEMPVDFITVTINGVARKLALYDT